MWQLAVAAAAEDAGQAADAGHAAAAAEVC